MEKGQIHLYWGDGKGKTTAAMGVALRSLAAGKKVVIVQFLKDAESGEIVLLQKLGAKVYKGKACPKFVSKMNAEEKRKTKEMQDEHLRQALTQNADLLILDEACGALRQHMVDETLLKEAVLQKPREQELILTGRAPSGWMLQAADYCTEMHCWNHPFQKGVRARKGVEY